ncbi:uncharacterized protein BDW43DRAFT_308031 [Aspergillus alliaceus]|uniref:uncharacterized protein n=1 Tax=Petromyces alliaceus TaxID=209559 RepID=UPI0012A56E68|nr:uncharacterized protein BDW43DRAFT_308031 [Aspergillus alliaceus]KAB8237019.1 hypothetical protein BDW43DRAFT_308031 [Aspergillus alliaceus]
MVWQEIVSEWLPGREGYKWGFKDLTLNMPDVAIIRVWALVQDPQVSDGWTECQILLIECKRPSSDTSLGWHITLPAQLGDDLSQSPSFAERRFGTISIGKKLRFYRFDGRAQTQKEWFHLSRAPSILGDQMISHRSRI